jgi:gliding motility-associated-like protein
MQKLLHTFFFVLLTIGLFAQNKSNRGKEFWLAYGFDYTFFNEPPINSQDMAIYISTGQQAANVTVTVTNTSYTQTLSIPANTADASIIIPKSGPNDARTLTDGLQTKNIHIVSDVPVAVYSHVYATMVSGATMLMPVDTYGYNYYSVNYDQTSSQSSPNDWYSWFYAIASEDNTRIEITPSDSTKNGWLPGQTYTVNLNKGESYHVFGKAIFNGIPANASKDMTGSRVLSVEGSDGKCHPIAVFSGSGGIRLCRGDGGEFMQQQVFPAQAWGTRYLTFHTINNTNTNINETNRNYYRVCVQDPTTIVKRNGNVLTGLIKNFYYEFMDSTGGDYITSDKPILVAQYMTNKNQCWNFPTTNPSPPSYGDPEMFYISPIEQGQKSVVFYKSRKSSIDYVYVNIHVPTSAINSLRVNGAPIIPTNTRIHPNLPSYTVAVARLLGPAAQHSITCDSAFTATVYGLGNYESYGYNVGCLVNNLNAITEIKNKVSTNLFDTVTCTKTPFTLYANLAYQVTSIHWKLSQANGIVPNTDSLITNPTPIKISTVNGRTYYTYSLQQDFYFTSPGTYTIPVSYTAPDVDACNNTETATITVNVKPGPTADFSFSNPNCLIDTVNLTGNANPNGFTLSGYLWNFDDNTTVNTVNAKKKFSSTGAHPVKYTIITDNGCSHDTTKTVTIQPSPEAKFGFTSPICAGDSTRLTDSSTVSVGTLTNWYWDFGNGITSSVSSNAPIFQTYNTPGSYTIKLVASSNNGCKSDTARGTLVVNPLPIAKFGISGNICVGDSVRITDSSSTSVGSITQWIYDFGDGNTATKTNNAPFYHRYNTSGNYTITLRVVSSNGCRSQPFSRGVSVTAPAPITFSVTGLPCVDSQFRFTSSVPFNPNAPVRYYWSFGDGQSLSSTSSNTISHAYTNTATNLVVKHMVSYGTGCNSDTTTQTIVQIFANPTAQYTLFGGPFCEGSTVLFQGNASPDATTWIWNFGNGVGSQPPPISRVYSTAGSFNTSLMVRNAQGCGSNLSTQPLVILPAPIVNAGPDQNIKKGESVVLNATVSNTNNYSVIWSPTTDLNNPAILRPTASPSITTTYQIRVTDNAGGCSATDEVTIQVFTKLFVPNAFSPNGDGNNDYWALPGIALYPDALVSIYNRWGQKIFETKNYANNPWRGFYRDRLQNDGVYVYIIQLNNAEKEVLKGTVNLVK